MSNSIQKPLNCRNARCGAMCSMAIAEIFSTKPSKCPYFKYAPNEYDAEHDAKVRAEAIAASLSILHWDNGCSKCPLIEECKKNDEEDKQCQDVWYNWLENINDK